jgi:hypothetical protein
LSESEHVVGEKEAKTEIVHWLAVGNLKEIDTRMIDHQRACHFLPQARAIMWQLHYFPVQLVPNGLCVYWLISYGMCRTRARAPSWRAGSGREWRAEADGTSAIKAAARPKLLSQF